MSQLETKHSHPPGSDVRKTSDDDNDEDDDDNDDNDDNADDNDDDKNNDEDDEDESVGDQTLSPTRLRFEKDFLR